MKQCSVMHFVKNKIPPKSLENMYLLSLNSHSQKTSKHEAGTIEL